MAVAILVALCRTSNACILSYVLDVIRVEGDNGDALAARYVAGVLYGFSRGKHRQRQFVSPAQWLALALIPLIFCPFPSSSRPPLQSHL